MRFHNGYYSVGQITPMSQINSFTQVASDLHSQYLQQDVLKTDLKYSEMSLLSKARLDHLTENEVLLAKDDVRKIHLELQKEIIVEKSRHRYYQTATIGAFLVVESFIIGLYLLTR